MRTVRQLQELGMRKKDARVLRKIGLRRWKEIDKANRHDACTHTNCPSWDKTYTEHCAIGGCELKGVKV